MSDDMDDLERRVHDSGLPGLASYSALLRRLNDMGDVTVTVPAEGSHHGRDHYDEHEIDKIHDGLLKKKRSGRLGLNDD